MDGLGHVKGQRISICNYKAYNGRFRCVGLDWVPMGGVMISLARVSACLELIKGFYNYSNISMGYLTSKCLLPQYEVEYVVDSCDSLLGKIVRKVSL